MKATKYISLAAIALMGTLASCQSDDDFAAPRPADAVNMHIQVGSLQTTRSNPTAAAAADQQKFNTGDQVSISATGQDAVIYQLGTDGQTWTETEANKFLLWNAASLEFQAYYPVTTGTSMTAFTLPADQSSETKIAAADYMTKTETIARPATGTDISLELQRQTARVIVNIAGFNNQYYDEDKQVSNVRINSAAAAIADGAASGAVTAVTPFVSGDGTQGTTYTALVIPAAANATANFVTLTDGESSNLTVKGIPALEAGKSYTFDLTVGKNVIRVSNVTVVDWTTGETLTGGQATEGSATTLVTDITLNKTATTIIVGNTETLSVSSVTPSDATDQTVTWSSDNESVATVNATTGVVTAVAAGTANITATANDGGGATATCAVTVTPPPSLADAFTEGAVVSVTVYMNNNNYSYTASGTFSGGSYTGVTQTNTVPKGMLPNSDVTMTKNGNNLVVFMKNYYGATCTYTFNATNNTYTGENGSTNVYGYDRLKSITINGYDITSQLTKQ